MMNALGNYAGEIKLEYSIRFENARTKSIVDYTISSEYLLSRTDTNHAWYVRLAKAPLTNN